MNATIREHVIKYLVKIGEETTDDDIIEVITDSKEVWIGDADSHRWWDCCFKVVEVDGMLIGFDWATTTGDDSARDKGWEFDPETICEVEEKQITKTIYSRK